MVPVDWYISRRESRMAFKKLDNAILASDRGFQVQILSGWEIQYREGDRVMTLLTDEDSEHNFAIDLVAFSRWDGMAPDDELSTAEQERIETNLMDALAYWGFTAIKRPFF